MSFYSDATVAVKGTVAGKTLYVMLADVMDVWVIDIVERQPTGEWTQFGWNLESVTMAKVSAAGGPSKWLAGVCARITAFLVKVFGVKPPMPESDVKTMEDLREYMRQTAELYDIGMRQK